MDQFCGSNQPFLQLLNSQEIPSLSQINFSQKSHQTHPITNLPVSRKKWTANEDVILCSAWLNTSKDAIVSNEQRNTTFWNCVTAYFNVTVKLKGLDSREAGKCKQRWQKINEGVSKFIGVFEAVTRNRRSGENDDNILSNAYKIYQQDHKLNFNLENAWLELRNDQKWCSTLGGNCEWSAKRRIYEEVTSKPVDEEAERRPIGVKAAKGKTKKKRKENLKSESVSLETYQTMWSIKEKDLALKNELAKIKMLETLLSKTTPLSELENKLKGKLITEMLNE